jgi:uncharacterized protein YcfJ
LKKSVDFLNPLVYNVPCKLNIKGNYDMKKVTLPLVMLVMASQAYAQETSVNAVVNDHYRNVNNPIMEQVCQDVEVPVYSNNSQFNQGGAIIGGLIGGVIGNQFGKGNGKEAATGVGAMTGAIIGGSGNRNNNGVVGYRREQRCSMQNVGSQTYQSYSGSSISFVLDGKTYHLNFKR